MKTTIKFFILGYFLFLTSAFALKSPIPASIPGIELPNTHFVSEDQLVIRSMAPNGYYDDVEKLGIEKVLIFKNQTKKEVDQEITDLKERGFKNEDILHVPFKWHDFESQYSACVQTIEGLNFILSNQERGDSTLVHCTVGEDRTGHIMALYRIITQNWNVQKAFQEEMCERGYGRGNKNKPAYVVGEVRSDLTPIFFKMATILKEKYRSGQPLKSSWCRGIDQREGGFQKCRWSSVFNQ